MFKKRSEAKTSKFVFAGNEPGRHFSELKRPLKQVTKACGIAFSAHDLRRSFAVFGESLDLSAYTLKRLLNHSTGGDVTMHHYLPIDIERLRKPMERIADFVLGHSGKLVGENVLHLPVTAASAA